MSGQEQNAMQTQPNEKRKWRLGLCWFAAFLLLLLSLVGDLAWHLRPEFRAGRSFQPELELTSPIALAALPTATRFDFPLGGEHGAMTYNAQPFTQNHHLGDDLNGIGGENSDLGDPVYAIADGQVIAAHECGPGWGNVVIILHAYNENGRRQYVQSFYGHVQSILVNAGEKVHRGQEIATVGTGGGRYLAHLHFEMREFVTPFIGAGYRKDTKGWLNPSDFVRRHRGAPDQDVGREPFTR